MSEDEAALEGTEDTVRQRECLDRQNSRLVDEFRARKFEREAKKHWDLFYKRNEDRFFKDRHWTTREFKDLIPESSGKTSEGGQRRVLVEFGCGVGNFAFPLLQPEQPQAIDSGNATTTTSGDDTDIKESNQPDTITNRESAECHFFIYACDFSPRAVDIVKSHPLYQPENIVAFTLDITTDPSLAFTNTPLEPGTADIASLMFVLSALKPEDFSHALTNARNALKPGSGVLIMRDYAVNDMAMLRFGPGTKIQDRHYVRQDGTMTYFFNKEEIESLTSSLGFSTRSLEYVKRRTVNKKEGVDVPRLFIQGVFVRQE